MGKIEEVINNINNQLLPYTPEEVKDAFNKRLLQLEYTQKEGITVSDVVVDMEGDVFVTFIDNETDQMDVIFGCSNDADGDGEEDCFAMIIGGDDDEEVDIIDLDNMDPPMIEGTFSLFMDLTNVSWMNKSTFGALFNAGDVGVEGLKDSELIGVSDEEVEERFVRRERAKKKVVFRGGKRQRVAVVTRRGRQRLSGKQRAGLRKARRAAAKSGAVRKRKRAFKRRKALGLKRRTRLKGEIR